MKTPLICTLFLPFILLISCDGGESKEVKIENPDVQHIEVKGDAFSFQNIQLESPESWSSLVNRTPVKERINGEQNNGLTLKIALDENFNSTRTDSLELEGAYHLKTDSEGIDIVAKDSMGVFYGLQTLNELIAADKILPVEIDDYPALPYRGVVEGFYGTPWSTEARVNQIKFYGTVKANTYIYGPKDDPYHSSPNWRKPYPEDQADNIKKLVGVANANFVDFVWAIHPGGDIKWNDEDRDNVLKKFEHMYDLGVRSFALFFDDISGEGTSAHKQAELLNYLTDEFVKVKGDVKPLILTPTDYNKGWANPGPDGYLSILGRELDPSVQIMWTGDNVMSDVTKSTADWVKERIQRPSLIWWNFPVSDYQRNRLFIEASYGLEEGLTAGDITGVLSNPMEHAEASKPAIEGVAHYGWNTKKYDVEGIWKKSIKKLLPKTHDDYVFFAENNGTPNTDLTSHIDMESVGLIDLANQIEKTLKNDEEIADKDLEILVKFFQRMQNVGEELIKENEDPDLIGEVKPWLKEFSNLGKIGESQIENYKARNDDSDKYWETIQKNQVETAYDRMFVLGDSTKVKITTGSAVIRPLIKALEEWNNKHLLSKLTGDKDIEALNPELGQLITDLTQLQNLKVIAESENKVKLTPILEVFEMEPSESFTMSLTEPIAQGQVKFHYNSGYYKWLKIETSLDGEQWKEAPFKEANWQHAEFDFDQPLKYVRISNKKDEMIDLRLFEMSITDTEETDESESYLVHDLDVFTHTEIGSGKKLIENAPESEVNEVVVLTDAEGGLKLEGRKADGSWEELSGEQKNNLYKVDLSDDYEVLRISSDKNVKIYEVIWK